MPFYLPFYIKICLAFIALSFFYLLEYLILNNHFGFGKFKKYYQYLMGKSYWPYMWSVLTFVIIYILLSLFPNLIVNPIFSINEIINWYSDSKEGSKIPPISASSTVNINNPIININMPNQVFNSLIAFASSAVAAS